MAVLGLKRLPQYSQLNQTRWPFLMPLQESLTVPKPYNKVYQVTHLFSLSQSNNNAGSIFPSISREMCQIVAIWYNKKLLLRMADDFVSYNIIQIIYVLSKLTNVSWSFTLHNIAAWSFLSEISRQDTKSFVLYNVIKGLFSLCWIPTNTTQYAAVAGE